MSGQSSQHTERGTFEGALGTVLVVLLAVFLFVVMSVLAYATMYLFGVIS